VAKWHSERVLRWRRPIGLAPGLVGLAMAALCLAPLLLTEGDARPGPTR